MATYRLEYLTPAPTLKDLRERIDEAIENAGEDVEWYGWDDGTIHITDLNNKVELVIE